MKKLFITAVVGMTLFTVGCSQEELAPEYVESGIEMRVSPDMAAVKDRSRNFTTHIIAGDNISDNNSVLKEEFKKYANEINFMGLNSKNKDLFLHRWLNYYNDKDDWFLTDEIHGHSEADFTERSLWPISHNVDFFAVTNCIQKEDDYSISIKLDKGVRLEPFYDFKSYKADRVVGQDVLYAVSLNERCPSDENYRVPLHFKHAMSKINFQFENHNDDVIIMIDNVDMYMNRDGAFYFDMEKTGDDAMIHWDMDKGYTSNFERLSYECGYFYMCPIVMYGNEGYTYTPQFFKGDNRYELALNNNRDNYRNFQPELAKEKMKEYPTFPEEFRGKNLYHLVVPQRIPDGKDLGIANSTVKKPCIAVWMRVINRHAADAPRPCVNLQKDNYNQNEVKADDFSYVYSWYQGDVYGFNYVFVPLCKADGSGFDLEPGKEYTYKIIFTEGGGWGLDGDPTMIPIKTEVTLKDWIDGGTTVFTPVGDI